MKRKSTIARLIERLIQSGSTWIIDRDLESRMEKLRIPKYQLEYAVRNREVLERYMDGRYYYSLPFYDSLEKHAAKEVMRILNSYSPWSSFDDIKLNRLIKEGEEHYKIALHDQQREAVIGGVKHGFFVITGGPGTGKTAVLKILTYVLSRLFFGVSIKFVAPTGKAARRITETTRYPAKTIQRLLKINHIKRKPDIFVNHVLIVDEVSMLDMELADILFSAIKSGRKLILVGDIEQLPSVGPGAVLRDLLYSEVIPYTMLTKTFRQSMESNLFANITKIKDGETELTQGYDFEIHDIETDAVQQLLELYIKEMNKYGIEDVALLLPYRKAGVLCSNYLNNVIQEKVNPTAGKTYLETTLDDEKTTVKYTVGDPVIQLENRNECANGDVGFVKNVDVKSQKMVVKFFDTNVEYTVDELKTQLSLAYAISISKSQGSEYKSCVIGIANEHISMHKRNVIYTAITRAKERVVLLKDDEALMKSIYTDGSYERITFFAEDLIEQNEKVA